MTSRASSREHSRHATRGPLAVARGAALTAALSSMAVVVQVPVASAGDDQTDGQVVAEAVDDGFGVQSEGFGDCGFGGTAEYVDYGPGLSGGGNNDDYIEIVDWCFDGHGVKAWVWFNGKCLNFCLGAYNGYGAGEVVIWDPFPNGNVKAGDKVGLKVCNVDGDADSTGVGVCGHATFRSVDG
jgi:hypothetical protein